MSKGKRKTANRLPANIQVECRVKNFLRSKKALIRKIGTIRTRARQKSLQLNVLLTDDKEIARFNKRFKGKSYPTDVLAFESCASPQSQKIADIVISVETAKKNAREYGVRSQDEVLRYIAHGILHICGYKDRLKKEQEIMRKKEDRLIRDL